MMKLGKLPAKKDPRTLKLRDYLDTGRIVSEFKTYQNWSRKVIAGDGYGMFANDEIGDCVYAARAHALQTANECEGGTKFKISDSEVIADYKRETGYDGTPATDNGAYLLDALKSWRKRGMLAGGKRHKILAFAEVNVKSREEMACAINLFGGIYTGFRLPEVAQTQEKWLWYRSNGKTGEYEPGSWGGHCMFCARTSNAQTGLITWGREKLANHGFFETYCDEAYVVLQNAWAIDAIAPNGFELEHLLADLRARTGAVG